MVRMISKVRLVALCVLCVFAVNKVCGEPLTLPECLRILEEQNPTLIQARQTLESSRMDVAKARASLLPNVEARLSADLWRRYPGSALEGVIPGTDKEPRTDITAAWKILDPQRWLRYSQAVAQREQAAFHGELILGFRANLPALRLQFLHAGTHHLGMLGLPANQIV